MPLNFGYRNDNDKVTLYFHGAREGKKIDLIKASPLAAFEFDTATELVGGEDACSYSYLYQSVLGYGRISLVEDEKEKLAALRLIMNHYTDNSDWQFPESAIKAVEVIKLAAEEISGKQHLRKQD